MISLRNFVFLKGLAHIYNTGRKHTINSIFNYLLTSMFERPRTFSVPTKNKQIKFKSLPRMF